MYFFLSEKAAVSCCRVRGGGAVAALCGVARGEVDTKEPILPRHRKQFQKSSLGDQGPRRFARARLGFGCPGLGKVSSISRIPLCHHRGGADALPGCGCCSFPPLLRASHWHRAAQCLGRDKTLGWGKLGPNPVLPPPWIVSPLRF